MTRTPLAVLRVTLALAGLLGVLVGPASGARATPVPRPGYHHLGATTSAAWSGVMGRLTVADPGVRSGTYDFVAARFMARTADGTSWLEAGWSENGWLSDGRQRVYTYDTIRRSWTFYDQYPTRPGDQIWIYLESSGTDAWRAWLFTGDNWYLLAEVKLPLGATATIEQYVEVYVDPVKGGTVPLPTSAFDNVQLRDGTGEFHFWREDAVPTGVGESAGDYCLGWATRFDTWSAATCP